MRTKRARWMVAVVIVCGGVFIAWRFAGGQEEDLAGRVSIELAVQGNGYGAHVTISNQSRHGLRIQYLQEVKTGGEWPVYGPELRPMRWHVNAVLESHTNVVVKMGVPNYGEKWRVVVEHQPAPGWMENLRSRSAAMLAARGWPRLANAVRTRPNAEPFARSVSAEWPVRDSPWVRQ